MKTRRLPLSLVAIVLLSACASSDEAPPRGPTSAFPSGTTSPLTGPTGTTGSASPLPTSSPGAGTGDLSGGLAEFELSGGIQTRKTLPVLVTAVYTPPPGGLAMVWTAGGADASTLGIGGQSFTGTRTTSPTLTISLTAQAGGRILTFLSMDGECAVTIDVARPGELAGSVRCDELTSDQGVAVAATVSFEAAG